MKLLLRVLFFISASHILCGMEEDPLNIIALNRAILTQNRTQFEQEIAKINRLKIKIPANYKNILAKSCQKKIQQKNQELFDCFVIKIGQSDRAALKIFITCYVKAILLPYLAQQLIEYGVTTLGANSASSNMALFSSVVNIFRSAKPYIISARVLYALKKILLVLKDKPREFYNTLILSLRIYQDLRYYQNALETILNLPEPNLAFII